MTCSVSRTVRYCSHLPHDTLGRRVVTSIFGNMVDAKKRPWSLEVHPVSFGNMESSDSISLSRLSSRLFISRSTLSLLAGAMLELLTIPNPLGVRMMSRCGIALRNASKATMRAIVTFAVDGSGRSAMSSKISFGQKLSMSHFV